MKDVNKIVVTLRKIDHITVELSEDTGYELPSNVVDFHNLLTQITENPELYIKAVDLAEADTEFVVDSFAVEEV